MNLSITDFLKKANEFQEFASKRGLELLMALGCNWKMYETPDKFEFGEDGVVITFQENTNHDCPDYETICLKIEELEKNEEEWNQYITLQKAETLQKQRKIELQKQEEILEEKKKQFEKLKQELGQ